MNDKLFILFVSVPISLSGCYQDKSAPIHQSDQVPRAEVRQVPPAQAVQSRKPEDSAMSTDNLVPIFDYLYMIGDQLDCYFTAERMASTATYTSPLEASVIDPELVTSIDALVDKLNNDLDGVTATRSSNWPKVIHLVEDALGNVSGYAIEEEVTLEFSGTVNELVLQLGEELNGRIGRVTGGGLPPGPLVRLYDDQTETEINAEDETVSNILTSAVPLEDYNRVLWGATTYLTISDHNVEVSFGGPSDEEE